MSNLIVPGIAADAPEHYSVGTRQIYDGKEVTASNTQIYTNVHLGQTINTYATVGGFSGRTSGADKNAMFMEMIPEGAKAVVLQPWMLCDTTGSSTATMLLYACHPDDPSPSLNDSYLVAKVHSDVSVSGYEIASSGGEIIVPLDSNGWMKLGYNYANNGTARYIRAYYRGFMM